MGMQFQLYRAWANTSKGLRQCQRADGAIQHGKAESAANHYNKALSYFTSAVDHLAEAEDDAQVKAGKLLDDGNQQLQDAIDQYGKGHANSAVKHYEKALDKYDEALNLID